MKIRLWVPAVDDPNWPAVLSWMNTDWPEGCKHDFVRSGHGDLANVWNRTVEQFLESDCDWLWSCHSDIEFKPGTLKRLLSWDKPFISALMFMRHGAASPHIWEGKPTNGKPGYLPRYRETFKWFFGNHMEAVQHGSFIIEPRPSDALFKVDFSSTGCTLIHRKVFEAIEYPWFYGDVPMEKIGPNSPKANTNAGEDRYFYEKAAAAGFEAYVDRSVIAGHMPKDVTVGLMDFACWMTALDPLGKEEAEIACNMGPTGQDV